MVERFGSVKLRVEMDTNKRTVTDEWDVIDLDEAVSRLIEWWERNRA